MSQGLSVAAGVPGRWSEIVLPDGELGGLSELAGAKARLLNLGC